MATDAHASWRPNWAVPPGEVLLEALQERAMSQAELARRMNRPIKTINEIVKGKAAITPETAIQLEPVLGIAASFWNNLERNYREQLARGEANQQLERDADWVRRFPIRDMVHRGVLPRTSSKAAQLTELLRFFGVSSPAAWERHWKNEAVSFRRSQAFAASPEAVAVWLRLGELKAMELDCAPFDAGRLQRELPAIRQLTQKKPLAFSPELEERLNSCGVALVLTAEIKGTHLSGATRRLGPNKVLVQLSLRHRSDDQFWFALFHELGHVLRGSKRQSYLDAEAESSALDQDEAEADRFASNQLIPAEDYQLILRASDLSAEQVREVARQIGVSPGIIVGRLQRERHIRPSEMNFLKQQFHWLDEPHR